ncbi:hypothetical protein SAMD00019534_124280 [Acytostelium subglobosum LB1]|uniref:hypothetical protein n=1 Tax=Acytostelium subglobosum LB1 TaxID=1410327 RepID=UPI00064484C8|nr:hypothetical protein SAMD00019534_124280 [Acytostelium subglobosum LB1]GAM29252.1 hypothetical protein SAMD00019534_124280 [Acytostelium subglobosum LB1]|eukprot:XP_012747826.1 hypothetical protein SAMD00019534_124280 [Acytostelium subglobosum LB1]
MDNNNINTSSTSDNGNNNNINDGIGGIGSGSGIGSGGIGVGGVNGVGDPTGSGNGGGGGNKNSLRMALKNFKQSFVEIESIILKLQQRERSSMGGANQQQQDCGQGDGFLNKMVVQNNARSQELARSNQKQQETIDDLQKRLELQDRYLDEYKSNFIRINEQVKQIEQQYMNLKDIFTNVSSLQNNLEKERADHVRMIQELQHALTECTKDRQVLVDDKVASEKRSESQASMIADRDEELKRNADMIQGYREDMLRLENEKKDLLALVDESVRQRI